jgi:NADPH:quinone reductase-like Zn-dependent oxidoreductase
MHAVRVHPARELSYEEIPDPVPGPGEVLVELRRAALNRRDLLVCRGVYPFALPLIPGSDGAGVRRDTGEEVVILPGLHWGPGEAAPGPDFEILGGPRDGTYAELIALPEENLYPRPAAWSWDEAAAFPLAALTAYRALFSRGLGALRLFDSAHALILPTLDGMSIDASIVFAEGHATKAALR